MEASELNEILDQHKLWIETKGKQGKHAYLGGAILTRANLTRANLYCANLSLANLTDAHLTGASLTGASLTGANLTDANLNCAYLTRANLQGANLQGAIGLPNISWIIPGCLVQLNQIKYGFYLEKEDKYEDFVQDSFGFIIQNNGAEKTFDMLVEDQIIRNIPDWVKYSGLKQVLS